MAYTSAYHDDSDADDEFERSVFVSPTLPTDLSPTDSDMASAQHTPTTFTHSQSGGSHHASPTGLISHWTSGQCADFVSSLGLGQYADAFVDEAINGEALIEMQHQDFKDMGMTSVGHRLTLMRGVYDTKAKQNVPHDPDHYVPLSAEGNVFDMAATQDDIARVIESIRQRDQRIIAAEADLRVMKDDLNRVLEDNRKLREETLPMVRMAKDRSQPLPSQPLPDLAPIHSLASPPAVEPRPAEIRPEKAGSGLSRKFSTKRLFLGSAPKNPSPTISAPLQDPPSLEPSPAAIVVSNHLLASMASQPSPSTLQPSPTSPAYSVQSTSAPRSFPRNDGAASARTTQISQNDDSRHSYATSSYWSGATLTDRQANSSAQRRAAPTSVPTPDEPPNSAPLPSSSSSTTGHRERERDNDNIEILKSFRVSIEDPCHKVLPVALKRYQINDDWRQYALYIVHGDQERCLGLEEKPLMLFKDLDRQGRKPMFMLRKHASPAGEGWSSAASADGRGLPGGVL